MGSRAAEAGASLERVLHDPDSHVRGFAAEALWKITGKTDVAVPTLVEVLGDANDVEARLLAARVLGRIGPRATQAVPALEKARNDKYDLVREFAVEALQRIKGEGAGSSKTPPSEPRDPPPPAKPKAEEF
jgi:HEAT repeat protein